LKGKEMIDFQIREANTSDTEAITELAIRSKGHWGYSKEQMATFRSELTLTPSMLESRTVFVGENDAGLVGYYSLIVNNEEKLELEHLFVEPSSLRRGIGTRLYEHAKLVSGEKGYDSMVIQCDPNALGFYLKLGAAIVKEVPSSIPGRSISVCIADLVFR